MFLGCDAVSFLLASLTALTIAQGGVGTLNVHRSLSLWPALAVFFPAFALQNLYPGIIYNAVTELRRMAFAITLSFVMLASLPVPGLRGIFPYRFLVLSWIAAMILTPLMRSVVRTLVCHQSWWGVPVAVFYTGAHTAEIVRELQANPEIGLRPVVLLCSSDILS